MKQIADRYRLEERLGKGTSGEVHRAWDTQTERMVALKLLTHADDTSVEARGLSDGSVIGQLSSAHVVPVLDTGLAADGQTFIVTQLIDGPSLAARFAAGPLPVRQLLFWGAQISEALAEAHAVGVVHGNLRPSNVMLDAPSEAGAPIARVTDFGLTTTVETPQYMPPEAWHGGHGPAGDLYQLGLMLHEGLRGASCFEGTPEALKRAHLNSAPPPLLGVDASVSGTVMRLLVKSPRARPQSAAEVAATLHVLAKTTPEAAHGLAQTDWPAAQSDTPSIVGKVWMLTSLSLLLVLAGILISSRLGTWDLPGSRVVEAPPVTFPQSTASGWILPPAAAAASAAAARKKADAEKAKKAGAASTGR